METQPIKTGVENPHIEVAHLRQIAQIMHINGIYSHVGKSRDEDFPGMRVFIDAPFCKIFLNVMIPPVIVDQGIVQDNHLWWIPGDQPIAWGLGETIIPADEFGSLPDTYQTKWAIIPYFIFQSTGLVKTQFMYLSDQEHQHVGYAFRLVTHAGETVCTIGNSLLPMNAVYHPQYLGFHNKKGLNGVTSDPLKSMLEEVTKLKTDVLDIQEKEPIYLRHTILFPCMDTEYILLKIINVVGSTVLLLVNNDVRTQAGHPRILPLTWHQYSAHFSVRDISSTGREKHYLYTPHTLTSYKGIEKGDFLEYTQRFKLLTSREFRVVSIGRIEGEVYFQLEDSLYFDSQRNPRVWLVPVEHIQKNFKKMK